MLSFLDANSPHSFLVFEGPDLLIIEMMDKKLSKKMKYEKAADPFGRQND